MKTHAESSQSPRQTKVLIIDDDPATREILQRTLRREGYHVISANNGSEGLDLAQALIPDLITLDVQMPDMDGWQVLTALKHDPTLSHVPVVMITIEDQHSLGYALGASGYLGKPIDRSRLTEMVSKFCRVDSQRPVLVVEDEPDIRHTFKKLMIHEGWLVVEASDGAEAIQQVEAYNPQLILLDLCMPKMDGFEFIQRLRAMEGYQEIPVIVVTAKSLTEEEQQIVRANAQQLIYKGISTHQDILNALQGIAKK